MGGRYRWCSRCSNRCLDRGSYHRRIMVKQKITNSILRYCNILYYSIWQLDKYTNNLLIDLVYFCLKKIGLNKFAEKGKENALQYNSVEGSAIIFSSFFYDIIITLLSIGIYFNITAFTGVNQTLAKHISFPVVLSIIFGYIFAFITIRDSVRDKYFEEFDNEKQSIRHKYYFISIIIVMCIILLLILGLYLRFFRS